jgi:hypothetical protein
MYSDDMVFSSASESVAPLLSLHLLQVCSAWTPTQDAHSTDSSTGIDTKTAQTAPLQMEVTATRKKQKAYDNHRSMILKYFFLVPKTSITSLHQDDDGYCLDE